MITLQDVGFHRIGYWRVQHNCVMTAPKYRGTLLTWTPETKARAARAIILPETSFTPGAEGMLQNVESRHLDHLLLLGL